MKKTTFYLGSMKSTFLLMHLEQLLLTDIFYVFISIMTSGLLKTTVMTFISCQKINSLEDTSSKKIKKMRKFHFITSHPLDILFSNETFFSSASCKGCSQEILKNALNSIEEQALRAYGMLVQINSTILIYFNSFDDPFNSFYRFSFQSPNMNLAALLTQLQKDEENHIQLFSTKNIHHHLDPKNFLEFIQDDLRNNFKNINPKDINILLSLFGFLKALNYNLPTNFLRSSDDCQNYATCKTLMDQFMEDKVRNDQKSYMINFNAKIKYLNPVPVSMLSEYDFTKFYNGR